MIKVRLDCDSVAPCGARLTTFEITAPRFLLAEFNTHRDFSRNTASSRAIPVKKMIAAVRENCQVFEKFDAANIGMAAQEPMSLELVTEFKRDWAAEAERACQFAERWSTKAAKQMVNRALEPYMHTRIVVSATEWLNYFLRRAHPQAQPEFQVVAYNCLYHYLRSVPRPVDTMRWHTPLLSFTEMNEWDDQTRVIVSTARCARSSYMTQDVVKNFEDDEKLFNKLATDVHMSPFEHCARALSTRQQYGNFIGWIQQRKFMTNESGRHYTEGMLAHLMDSKPSFVNIY